MNTDISRLYRSAILILALLVVQFVLGMTLNLFTTFPTFPSGSTVPASQFIPIFSEYPVLLVHYLLGLLLFGASIVLLFFSYKTKNKGILLIGLLGFASVFGALISGIEFMVFAFQDNSYSFAMSIGFIAALLSYFAMLYKTKQFR